MVNIVTKVKSKTIVIRKTVTSLNVLTGLIKVFLAIFSKSLLFLIYSFYNIGFSLAKRTSVREKENYKYENYYFCGIIVLISSIIYILYSNYTYFNGTYAKYNLIVAISIATLAFYNITVAVIGIIKSKKQNNIQMQTIKLTNFASSLISMSLTQTVLLSTNPEKNVSKYSAVGGIFFGILSLLVGIYMIGYTIYMKSKHKL